MSNAFIVKFRLYDKVECCFDIVAGVNGLKLPYRTTCAIAIANDIKLDAT